MAAAMQPKVAARAPRARGRRACRDIGNSLPFRPGQGPRRGIHVAFRCPRRSGGTERFGWPVEPAGSGAVDGGRRLDQRCTERRMGNENGGGEDRLPPVTDGVATVEGRLARPVAIVGMTNMPRLGYRRFGHEPVSTRCVVYGMSGGRRVCGRRGIMPRRVSIGTNHAGHDQRKRHHGCNQPRRPCVGNAAHPSSQSAKPHLMAAYLANIKTEPLLLQHAGLSKALHCCVGLTFAACVGRV